MEQVSLVGEGQAEVGAERDSVGHRKLDSDD